MSGRILIVESIATNRIMLRATLQAAHYEVCAFASITEALAVVGRGAFDVALIDIGGEPLAALAFCKAIKADPALAELGVIAMTKPSDRASRMAALRAGADDVLDKGATDQLLLACIRSLLRARNAASELTLREDSSTALGFAEAAEGFAGTGRVALVTSRPTELPDALRMLLERLPGPAHLVAPGHDLTDPAQAQMADLYIIDCADLRQDMPQPTDLFRIVADLRSRSATQHAATLLMLPDAAHDLAPMALDLGANDQVSDAICADELAHRVRRLIRRKLRDDGRRDQVQSQLQLANFDPLTGLYNRRAADRRLARIVQGAAAARRIVAVMMLDIDHFKSVNDTFDHATGDRVLVEVARRLNANLRAVDLVSRRGGEEFLIAMPDTTADQAQGAAERLRRIIEDTPFDVLTQPQKRKSQAAGIQVTLSIGVAIGPVETPPGMSSETMMSDMIHRADLALQAAKSAGRNTVMVAA